MGKLTKKQSGFIAWGANAWQEDQEHPLALGKLDSHTQKRKLSLSYTTHKKHLQRDQRLKIIRQTWYKTPWSKHRKEDPWHWSWHWYFAYDTKSTNKKRKKS